MHFFVIPVSDIANVDIFWYLHDLAVTLFLVEKYCFVTQCTCSMQNTPCKIY